MNLSLTLRTVALCHGERPAVTAGGATLTYGAFENQVSRIAGSLARRHGIERGNRVAIVMENCADYLPALYGIWRAGAAAVPPSQANRPA